MSDRHTLTNMKDLSNSISDNQIKFSKSRKNSVLIPKQAVATSSGWKYTKENIAHNFSYQMFCELISYRNLERRGAR